jgi:hypothetical protein
MANEERCDNDEIAMATSIEIKLVLREKGASLLAWLSKNLHVVGEAERRGGATEDQTVTAGGRPKISRIRPATVAFICLASSTHATKTLQSFLKLSGRPLS